MAGDWAYNELLPIAAVELTILGSAVALCVNRRSHCLFPLPERPSRYALAYLQLVRLRRPATRFLIRKSPELCRLWVICGHCATSRRCPLYQGQVAQQQS